MSSLGHEDHIQVSFDLAPDYVVTAKQGAAIGLIVCEAMTNAIKYSHPTGAAGKVIVSARPVNDRFQIAVMDDGLGLPEGFDPKTAKTMGLKVMNALADQLGADLMFEALSIGFSVHLELPIADVAMSA
jgi:two-component sensor histidine kinase